MKSPLETMEKQEAVGMTTGIRSHRCSDSHVKADSAHSIRRRFAWFCAQPLPQAAIAIKSSDSSFVPNQALLKAAQKFFLRWMTPAVEIPEKDVNTGHFRSNPKP